MRSQVVLKIRFVDGEAEVEKALAILRKGRVRALQRMLFEDSERPGNREDG